MAIVLESTEDPQEREELKRMFTTEAPVAAASPDSDEWVPPWWGTDEDNAREAEQFASWTRGMRPVND